MHSLTLVKPVTGVFWKSNCSYLEIVNRLISSMKLNTYQSLNSMAPDLASLMLRIIGGAFMLTHGWPKFTGYSDKAGSFPDPLGVGSEVSLILVIFSEVFCAFLVLVGYKLRWAIVPLVITMIIAAFVIHADDPFGYKESSLIYLLIYLSLFFLGSGRFSLDRYLR